MLTLPVAAATKQKVETVEVVHAWGDGNNGGAVESNRSSGRLQLRAGKNNLQKNHTEEIRNRDRQEMIIVL